MPVPRDVALARSAVANAVKDGAPAETIEQRRRVLAAAKDCAETDAAISLIVARAGKMTAEQAARISRLFTYIDTGGEG